MKKRSTRWILILFGVLCIFAIVVGIIALVQGRWETFCMEMCVACMDTNIIILNLNEKKESPQNGD